MSNTNATVARVTHALASEVATHISPLEGTVFFGLCFYGAWLAGHLLSLCCDCGSDGDDDYEHGNDSHCSGRFYVQNLHRMVRNKSALRKTISLSIGVLAFWLALDVDEFGLTEWGHWFLMFLVNMVLNLFLTVLTL